MRPFLLRRTKDEVLDDLPPKTEQVLECELDGQQRADYDGLRAHFRTRFSQAGTRGGVEVLQALLRLRQTACHPGLIDEARAKETSAKLEVILPLIEELIEAGHKALIFSQFTGLLGIVRKNLDQRGIRYAYLDGSTRKRENEVNAFQNDPEVPLFLVSLKAGGTGLNLTAADYVFLLDPWWNPAVEAQAIDRAHRIGREHPVHVYRIIAKDTIEERVRELQEKKRDLAAAVRGEYEPRGPRIRRPRVPAVLSGRARGARSARRRRTARRSAAPWPAATGPSRRGARPAAARRRLSGWRRSCGAPPHPRSCSTSPSRRSSRSPRRRSDRRRTRGSPRRRRGARAARLPRPDRGPARRPRGLRSARFARRDGRPHRARPHRRGLRAHPDAEVTRLFDEESRGRLQRVLSAHVIPGALDAAALLERGQVTTVGGVTLDVELAGGQLLIGGAAVSTNDLRCEGGVVHELAAVIDPSSGAADPVQRLACRALDLGEGLDAAGQAAVFELALESARELGRQILPCARGPGSRPAPPPSVRRSPVSSPGAPNPP